MSDIVQVHCNRCLGDRKHRVLFSKRNDWTDDDTDISGGETWILSQCKGCNSICLQREHWCSDDTDINGHPIISGVLFPPMVTRQQPIWRRHFLETNSKLLEINLLLDEIYEALGVAAYRLSTIGIRALVEKIMIDEVGDGGTIAGNMRAFFTAGFVAPTQQDAFEKTLINAGNAAMHRGFKPDADTVNKLLDMVEAVIYSIHYEPMVANQVNRVIPPRR
jgi:hypothetical protein